MPILFYYLLFKPEAYKLNKKRKKKTFYSLVRYLDSQNNAINQSEGNIYLIDETKHYHTSTNFY